MPRVLVVSPPNVLGYAAARAPFSRVASCASCAEDSVLAAPIAERAVGPADLARSAAWAAATGPAASAAATAATTTTNLPSGSRGRTRPLTTRRSRPAQTHGAT